MADAEVGSVCSRPSRPGRAVVGGCAAAAHGVCPPVKWRRISVSTSDRSFQGIYDLLRCLQILPDQRAARDDALD